MASYQVFKPDIPQDEVERLVHKGAEATKIIADCGSRAADLIMRVEVTCLQLEWSSGVRPTYGEAMQWLELWYDKMDGKW